MLFLSILWYIIYIILYSILSIIVLFYIKSKDYAYIIFSQNTEIVFLLMVCKIFTFAYAGFSGLELAILCSGNYKGAKFTYIRLDMAGSLWIQVGYME